VLEALRGALTAEYRLRSISMLIKSLD
jgi:hypothetical protein